MGHIRLFLLVALGVVCSLAAAAGSAAEGANLVGNPGAEETPPAAEEGGGAPPPPRWTAFGEFTVIDYGAAGAPPAPAGGGTRAFAGGPQPDPDDPDAGGGGFGTSSADQALDLSANAEAVDAGSVQANAAALIGGTGSGFGKVTIQFRDAAGRRTGAADLVLGPVGSAERGGESKLIARSGSAPVPPGTRRIRLLMQADGDPSTVFFDNVSLELPGATAPVEQTGGVGGEGTGGGSGEGPGGGESGGGAEAPVRISTRPVRMTRSGVIGIRLGCRLAVPCRGRLSITSTRAPRIRCASTTASVPAGRTRIVKLRGSRRCRRLVAAQRRGLPVTLRLQLGARRLSARGVVRRPF